MITIGGNVCVRNGLELDYCFKDAIESLLPVCDTVTVCDGCSNDGTLEFLRDWSARDSRIRLCVYPWPNPKGDPSFWVEWLNYCRIHIREDYQIQLDADEILSESSYPVIRHFRDTGVPHGTAFWCRRYNFWGDTHHLIPHGVCCSHRVVRVAPQPIWMASDGPDPRGNALVAIAVEPPEPIEIFHYGFLRKREAFFEKARRLQHYFFHPEPVQRYDARLDDVEHKPGNWMMDIKGIDWLKDLIPFDGKHPERMKPWLKERGWEA